MPYAAGNTISTAPLEGGIQITHEQYTEALEAITNGQEFLVIDGVFVIRDMRPSEYHEWENGQWVEYLPEPEPDPEPDDPPPPPVIYPQIVAQARISIEEDGTVGGVGGDTGIAGVMPIMDGYIYVMLAEDLGTDQYIVTPTVAGPYLVFINEGDQMSDAFALTIVDVAGNPATPKCIPLLISKV